MADRAPRSCAFLIPLLAMLACRSPPEIVPAPPPVHWTRPEASLTVNALAFQRWPPLSLLFTVGEVNLRAAPETTAEVVRRIPMGTTLKILTPVGETAVVEGRQSLWYRVSYRDGEAMLGGFVFGATLTPIALPTLEGLLIATFSPEHQPRLRLQHPSGMPALDLGDPGKGGTLRVEVDGDIATAELCAGLDCTSWRVRLDQELQVLEPEARESSRLDE